MPYTWKVPPTPTMSDPDAPSLSDRLSEWFPQVAERATYAGLACAGPGDADDDETDGGVGNIDPDDDEVYDGDEEDEEEDDTLWAVRGSSSRPPNRA